MLQTSPRPNPDFDFLLGVWKCRHRHLVRRPGNCHEWIEFDGTCAARKVLGGFGNVDESDVAFPGDRHRRMTIRLYDWDSDRWTIQHYDSRRPGRALRPVAGRFAKGVGIFSGDDDRRGRTMRVRIVWSHITPNSARWEQAFSRDEGDSWEVSWTTDFTRL